MRSFKGKRPVTKLKEWQGAAAEEIRLARIKRARELLVSTDMQVMMVGLSCGYDSPSGFVRAFREATGTTPQKYRQRSQVTRPGVLD